jgi:hypothetical protein
VSDQPRLVADRFRMIRRLGAGAMASVFLAEDCELGRRVAIKRLHPDSSSEVAPRFRREMRVAASLSHPNVVTLFDAIEHEGAVLLIMEYVEGPTLAQRMREGPLEPDAALAILGRLADAIDYLHEQGVIHRDIKPANILLDRAGQVKVTDLGIASAAQATGITTTGTVLGTPAYMAPELFEGERATRAADVYSVAAIAFEMLTGRRAREGGTPAVMAMRAATEPPPDLREIWPDAGPLAEVLERGLARDPGERPESATALVDAIAAALRERDAPATAPVEAVEGAPAPGPQRTAEVDVEPAPAGGAPGQRHEAARVGGPAARAPEPVPAPEPAARAAPSAARTRPGRSRPARRRRSPVALLAAAAALAAAAIVAVLLAGGGSEPKRRAASTPRRTTTTSSRSTASAATPAGAVRAFYGRAAAHRYADAWALAAPALRAQLGGFEAFRRQFSTVRSIDFGRATTVRRSDTGATVAIATTATHTDHVDHCAGTAETAPAPAGGWVVTHIAVGC